VERSAGKGVIGMQEGRELNGRLRENVKEFYKEICAEIS
jgi:hypothetical protein